MEQPRTVSKHMQNKFDDQRVYLDRLLDAKQKTGMYVHRQDITIRDLNERLSRGAIVNFKDNRDPEKTWSDQKRSLFVGDLYNRDATEPYIILWRETNADFADPLNVMDAMNRVHAIRKVLKGEIPLIIGHANGKQYWMPPPDVDPENPPQPSEGPLKCFLSPNQIKALLDNTNVVLLEWKNCSFEQANMMARYLNRATQMTAGQELRFVLNGGTFLSKLAAELLDNQFKWMDDPFFKTTGNDEVMRWLATFVFKMTNHKENVQGSWNNTTRAEQLEAYFNKNVELDPSKRTAVNDMADCITALVNATLSTVSNEEVKHQIGYLNSLAACILVANETKSIPTADMWQEAWKTEYYNDMRPNRGTIPNFKHTLVQLSKGAPPSSRPSTSLLGKTVGHVERQANVGEKRARDD